MIRYEREPAEIYRQSFAIVKKEARLERFPEDLKPLVIRLIHSCGMTEIADRIAFSANLFDRGRLAILSGAPIL